MLAAGNRGLECASAGAAKSLQWMEVKVRAAFKYLLKQ